MNIQEKIQNLREYQTKTRKVQKETRLKLMRGAISIQEIEAFSQVITAVIHNCEGRVIIKDLKTGPIGAHSERSARYHAEALGQGLIMVQRISGQISHMQVKP
jgi:hypothetical protein